MLNEFGAANADCEGIVSYGTETEGVRAAALLREQTGGRVKASLRSLGEVDVSRVALMHGGGGHAAAAGCTLVGGLDAVRRDNRVGTERRNCARGRPLIKKPQRRIRAARGLEWTDL